MQHLIKHRLSLASQARSEGRLGDAERICREIMAEHRWNPWNRLLLLTINFNKWACAAAVAQLTAISLKDPGSSEAKRLLSMALRKQDRYSEALTSAQAAANAAPDNDVMLGLLGQCHLDLGQFDDAEKWFRDALRIAPDKNYYLESLGIALHGQRRFNDAIRAYEAALELERDSFQLLVRLADVLILESKADAAASYARRIIELKPSAAVGHELLAQALLIDNKESEAEGEARKATELAPQDGHAFALHGAALQTLGKMDEAIIQCRRAIELEPRQGLAYFNLVRCRKVTLEDQGLVTEICKLSEDDGAEIRHKDLLEYALGKAFEDLGSFEVSMRHYDEANQIAYKDKFGDVPYNMDLNAEVYNALKRTYSASAIKDHQGAGIPSEMPIFVLGMMRSGTTLAEQILSAHPEVGAAGELRFWPQNRSKAFGHNGCDLDDSVIRELASQYLLSQQNIAPEKGRVVDKMPVNYLQLGLIHLALPNARIIHMLRDPADTCFSVYATQNRVRIPWAHDKRNIALNYLRYRDLMNYWKEVLPQARFLEVQYEDLVSDPERVTRSMIEFCGLEWSQECLSPEKNQRGVVTPSLWQVRQPIYGTSVQRWRKFEPWLQEFNLLDQLPQSLSSGM
jgi:tetratricopeptide (TPR) repeat protein